MNKSIPDELGFIPVDGVKLYYEIYGSGEPLVLIEGLGYATWMWFKQIPELSKHYKVIVFDNRGVGKSDKPEGDYSVELMASDAAAIIRGLGLEKTNVLGVSLGGFIAQQLALDYPRLVSGLILVSTGSKGISDDEYVPWGMFLRGLGAIPGALELTVALSGKASGNIPASPYSNERANLKKALSYGFTKEYYDAHREEIERIVDWRLSDPQPSRAWKSQFTAGVKFDSSDRLNEIKVPSLVVAGSEDRIVDAEISRELSRSIAKSKFVLLAETGHLLFIEGSKKFNKTVLGFLDRITKPATTADVDEKKESFWQRLRGWFSG